MIIWLVYLIARTAANDITNSHAITQNKLSKVERGLQRSDS